MGSFFYDLWYRVAEVPSDTWDWFNGLNREEWMVTLVVVCAAGFVCMLGFQFAANLTAHHARCELRWNLHRSTIGQPCCRLPLQIRSMSVCP